MYTIPSDSAFASTAVTDKENIWLLLFNYLPATGIPNINNSRNQTI